MTDRSKIVFIGATSMSFGLCVPKNLTADIMTTKSAKQGV